MIDRAFKREIDRLPIVCVHKKDTDCNWTGLLKDYQVCTLKVSHLNIYNI
jgi:hypothetical protein